MKPFWRRWFGSRAERAAERYLRKSGLRIAARNYRCAVGELDLVAVDGDCVVFVEVRSTEGSDPIRPALSVDARKQARLTKLALHFLQHHRLMGRPARFDIVAVSWPANAKEPNVVHHRSAFDAVGAFQIFQ